MADSPLTVQLREEFNRWAEAGRGEGMENDHLPIVLPALAHMRIEAHERILDVGCGTGWLCRMIAREFPEAQLAGMDVSDQMIERARAASTGLPNLKFEVGGVDAMPWKDHSFSKVISVESAYYWPDPARGIQETLRVLAPGGSAWILINYYRDNLHCHQWGTQFAIPAHLLAASEWAVLLRRAGFESVAHQRIPDESPSPEVYTGRWFRDAEQLRQFKKEGALLVHGVKPSAQS